MPFEKIGPNKFKSPSGRIYTKKQVQLYYATNMKSSGKVSWQWGGKTHYGTLIPSRETKSARFARTENGKIKRLPKKK
jgi:hypothetical protein